MDLWQFASLGTVLALLTIWQTIVRWRAHGVDQAREVVVEMRDVFGDVIHHHGLATNEFISKERPALASRLTDLTPTLRDRKLKTALTDVGMAWTAAFASAPPINASRSAGPTHVPEQVARQVDAARRGESAVKRVLARCNRLDHWVIG
jgi:hypothetical protein